MIKYDRITETNRHYFAASRHSDIVLPVCALKNLRSELGFSKPQKSDIAFSGIVPERRCWARASWRYQGRIATSLIKPQSCPTLIKRPKTWGTDPAKGPFYKGFAFLATGSTHGSIASSLASYFRSRVV